MIGEKHIGRVTEWNAEKNYGVVRVKDHKTILVMHNEIPPDNFGRQFLIVGEHMEFTEGRSDTARRSIIAKNIRFLDRDYQEEMPDDYREDVVLRDWYDQRGFGFATRKDGGQLFVHFREVISEGRELLAPGVWLRVKPEPPIEPGHTIWRSRTDSDLRPARERGRS
jgi:cold shock CspA family protein